MSNRKNHRRGESRRTEHGPRWENPDPGHGCNSTHVARARASWRALAKRAKRRAEACAVRALPEADDEDVSEERSRNRLDTQETP